jgi:hypothetical protein
MTDADGFGGGRGGAWRHENLWKKSKSVTLPAFDSFVKWNIQINFID